MQVVQWGAVKYCVNEAYYGRINLISCSEHDKTLSVRAGFYEPINLFIIQIFIVN